MLDHRLRRRDTQFFFVLSQGRSGTSFLAHLLDTDRNATVAHEPWAEDVHLLGLSRTGSFGHVVDDMIGKRFDAILRTQPTGSIYGEVNSYLRYLGPWLRSRLDATVLHVARDGRDFVRSAWPRDVQTGRHAQIPIVPADDDPWASRWANMDRFQRICWIWQHTNGFLLESSDLTARLEDLVTSYTTFRERILVPTGIRVDEATWGDAVTRPRNTTSEYTRLRRLRDLMRLRRAPPDRAPLPHWRDWRPEHTDAFWSICGEVMQQLGYAEDGGIIPGKLA